MAMAALLVQLIRAYQRLVSPLLPASCRYYPSCSQYAVDAVSRHGAVKGSWLATRRLARCHPWTPGGVDRVPLKDDYRWWGRSPGCDTIDRGDEPAPDLGDSRPAREGV
jgi:putative membrane protein insertion efficiency factor